MPWSDPARVPSAQALPAGGSCGRWAPRCPRRRRRPRPAAVGSGGRHSGAGPALAGHMTPPGAPPDRRGLEGGVRGGSEVGGVIRLTAGVCDNNFYSHGRNSNGEIMPNTNTKI